MVEPALPRHGHNADLGALCPIADSKRLPKIGQTGGCSSFFIKLQLNLGSNQLRI